jgi:hypothetical protein
MHAKQNCTVEQMKNDLSVWKTTYMRQTQQITSIVLQNGVTTTRC